MYPLLSVLHSSSAFCVCGGVIVEGASQKGGDAVGLYIVCAILGSRSECRGRRVEGWKEIGGRKGGELWIGDSYSTVRRNDG